MLSMRPLRGYFGGRFFFVHIFCSPLRLRFLKFFNLEIGSQRLRAKGTGKNDLTLRASLLLAILRQYLLYSSQYDR